MKKSNLTGVKFSRVSLVDKGASLDTKTGDGAHVLLFKRADPADEDKPMTFAEITKALATLTAEEKASLQKALGAAPAPEDILKNADPAIRAMVEKANADAKAANERATANETAIAELKKADRKVSLRKRVDIFANLSGDGDALASILGAVEDGLGADTAKKFEETLKAWDEQIKKGGVLQKGVGSRGTTETASGGSAFEEVQKLAAEIVTKDANVTEADAITRVFEAHPELHQRYHEETAGRGSKQDQSAS